MPNTVIGCIAGATSKTAAICRMSPSWHFTNRKGKIIKEQEAVFDLIDKTVDPRKMTLDQAIDFMSDVRDELDMRLDALKNDQKNQNKY